MGIEIEIGVESLAVGEMMRMLLVLVLLLLVMGERVCRVFEVGADMRGEWYWGW